MKLLHTQSRLATGIALILLLGAGGTIAAFTMGGSSAEATDDAYVTADFTLVAPKAFGLIDRVLVEDNESVRAGQLLVKIDDRDYKTALATAEANVLAARAEVANFDAEIARQPALVAQAAAAVRSDSAAAIFARSNAVRYQNLSADGSGTMQESQQAQASLRQSEAAIDKSSAAVSVARSELAVLQAGRARALAALNSAEAARDQAKLNLSYTEVRAPFDGYVGRRSVRAGSYANVGTPLLAVVPSQQSYIVANFQENQVEHMRLKQPVRIRVDAYPNIELKGHVDSLAPASDVAFSPIKPENATGNFTKIVQRVPVKIVFEPGQRGANLIRVGMSVVPTVDIAAVGEAPLGIARGKRP